MRIDTPRNTDWASLADNAQLRMLVDRPSGQDDNAFGQGTEEPPTSPARSTAT